MKMFLTTPCTRGQATRLALALLACCALALAFLAQARGATGQANYSSPTAGTPAVSVTLEGCVNTGEQANRSSTFSGEMTAITGSARMAMRIEVQERMPGEELFHTISAPGLGVWRGSEPGVKIYKYVKQVTNLSSPAVYRGLVRFHWLNDSGHVIRRAERHTSRCSQPAVPTTAPASPSPPLE
jgi:hypothetical protein